MGSAIGLGQRLIFSVLQTIARLAAVALAGGAIHHSLRWLADVD